MLTALYKSSGFLLKHMFRRHSDGFDLKMDAQSFGVPAQVHTVIKAISFMSLNRMTKIHVNI